MRFGKASPIQASSGWLHLQDIFSEFAPMGLALSLSWLPKGDTSALPAGEVTLGRVGNRELGKSQGGGSHHVVFWV